MRTTAKGLGYPNPFYWDLEINPNATITNGLANCTTYVFGAIKEEGHRAPVSYIMNASGWGRVLINGWMQIPFSEAEIEPGDIIQWVEHCHVAIATSKTMIAGSYYTGDHGKAYYNNRFDTRTFKSLEQMSDWMQERCPSRFFHHWTLAEENAKVGGDPEFILKHPLWSVKEDRSRDQIEVLSFEQNVRNDSNKILCKAEKGYYNVLDSKEMNGYLWYEVEKGKYIAQVDGRVAYRPPSNEATMDDLMRKIEELESKLDRIARVINE